MKERLDADDPALVQQKQAQVQEANEIVEERITEVDVGEYTFEPFQQSSENTNGTRIIADDVHPTFSQTFRESLKTEKFQEPSLEWRKALGVIGKVHSLQELGDYWKLLWELAAACPIPYVAADAVPGGLIRADQERLQTYDFKVIVDSLELAKPVYLKRHPGGYTNYRIEEQERTIYGRKLRFHGYLTVQEGKQIKPDELRGIMIRIKNVAIGYYDGSLLDYRFNEGPRSKWLTGEIYVDEGLEDALNVDRDSFNRFHPQFRAVQQHVHEILRQEIFPAVYLNIDVRTAAKNKERATERVMAFRELLEDATESKVDLATLRDDSDQPMVKRVGKTVKIQMPAEEALDTRKNQRQMAASILTLYELAMLEKSAELRRRKFTELLLRLLRKW